MFDPQPSIPDQSGIFTRISPAQFRAVARKAQGFTDAESGLDGFVAKKTISSYIETARQRLDIASTQELLWCYYLEYVPQLLYPDGAPDVVYGTEREVPL